jgi:hypothetical protein
MNQPAVLAPASPVRGPVSAGLRVRFLPFHDGDAPPPPETLRATFAEAWNARLGRTPHANFSMALDSLEWQARRGEPSRAVLLDEGDRRGAMVLRERGSEVVCGFPWRWQIVLEDGDPRSPQGMTPEDVRWFFAQARHLANGRRLRFYGPHPTGTRTEYRAAQTVLIDLVHVSEKELFSGVKSSRRSLVRRSEKQGYSILDATTPEQRLAFGTVVDENHARRHGGDSHGGRSTDPPDVVWTRPWHWLLLAVRNDAVAAGLGMGRWAGGMVDARAAGATEEAMKAGTNSQLWWEAIRRAHLAGHTWMNFGGSTTFKRQFGGALVPIFCALGGSPRWLVPNLVEKVRAEAIAFAVHTRQRVLAALKRGGDR